MPTAVPTPRTTYAKWLARSPAGGRIGPKAAGLQNFRFEASRHDNGNKTVFGQTGQWSYEDAVRLCVEPSAAPLVSSWRSSGATSCRRRPTKRRSPRCRVSTSARATTSGRCVEAILQHPDFLDGPELVTPPVVYNAGLLRAIGRPIDTTAWAWLSAGAGQQLFYPPNVSGWDFTRWLDTSTAKARWEIASYVTAKTYANPWPGAGEAQYSESEEPAEALASALAYWANPQLSAESHAAIAELRAVLPGRRRPPPNGSRAPTSAMRQNALRMLIATSPDMQVS